MDEKKIKIGLVHVWGKENVGDVAIVKAVRKMLIDNLSFPIEIEDYPTEILQKLNPINLERLNGCDVVIFGGGGIYNKNFLPYDTENIQKIKPPVVIFGVGYIREIGSEGMEDVDKKSLYELNAKAALASVRDQRTKELLVDAGVDSGKVELVGDPAIFLAENATNAIDFDMGRIRVGLNLNYAGWIGFGKYEEMIVESYNQVGKYFQDNFGAQIFYLKHHPGEAGILNRLDMDGLKVVDLEAEEQKYAYAKMDLVLGMKLHSAVLAFGAETPFLNLGYDVRNKSFGDFIGFPELVIGANELEEGMLISMMLEIFDKREYYTKEFFLRKKDILQDQVNFIHKIENLILENHGK
jgi:polysaccharide pyruvyl transferase WcaK-like protein